LACDDRSELSRPAAQQAELHLPKEDPFGTQAHTPLTLAVGPTAARSAKAPRDDRRFYTPCAALGRPAAAGLDAQEADLPSFGVKPTNR